MKGLRGNGLIFLPDNALGACPHKCCLLVFPLLFSLGVPQSLASQHACCVFSEVLPAFPSPWGPPLSSRLTACQLHVRSGNTPLEQTPNLSKRARPFQTGLCQRLSTRQRLQFHLLTTTSIFPCKPSLLSGGVIERNSNALACGQMFPGIALLTSPGVLVPGALEVRVDCIRSREKSVCQRTGGPKGSLAIAYIVWHHLL